MNTETETLVTIIPDYACRENEDMTVITTCSIRNGKVVKVIIQHGHVAKD